MIFNQAGPIKALVNGPTKPSHPKHSKHIQKLSIPILKMSAASNSHFLLAFFLLAFISQQAHGQGGSLDLGGLLGGLLGGGGGNGTGGVGDLGGVLNQVLQLVQQLLGKVAGGECPLLASVLGFCNPQGEACCGCCNTTSVGLNALCVRIPLLDNLLGNQPCPLGNTLVCTAQACTQNQRCNVANIANLACVNLGKK